MRPKPKTLLCTVGTSLLSNLDGLARRPADPDDPLRDLAEAHAAADGPAVAHGLLALPPTERTCGAEANSVASLVAEGFVPADVGLVLVHSDTDTGRRVAAVLADYFRGRGHPEVLTEPVPDLQDADPDRFRTRGLRNLAKVLCKHARERTPVARAVNAAGGYKAQIAVAVMIGQALGLPVYYMFERFARIVAFPPLPVAFDFEAWMRVSGLLFALDRAADPVPRAAEADGWTDLADALVEVVEIDGTEYVELSATGQVFHETFRERFRSGKDRVLPPPAGKKLDPTLTHHGVINRVGDELRAYLVRLTQGVGPVTRCYTTYCAPTPQTRPRFREAGEDIEGTFWALEATVVFKVESTARTPGQRAVLAALNEWHYDTFG